RRVRRGRPRLGTRGGRHLASIHGNSPSRNDWLPGPLDMSTTPPTMPAFRGFEESSADGVVIKRLSCSCPQAHLPCTLDVNPQTGLVIDLLVHTCVISNSAVHLGEGIAVCEEQLRAVKWSDYRKLTRGLAAILFSPTELATCSVTGQRWSRAGTATERPVKPALDRAKELMGSWEFLNLINDMLYCFY
ncbi:hypothetical protein PV326_003906, partial [Microctonus aethiopoides]